MPWINLKKKEIDFILFGLTTIYEEKDTETIKESGKIYKKIKKQLNPIKIRSAKNKGLNLQKWICKKISGLLNIPYNQQDDQCLIHSRESSQSGCDIILRGEALKRFPFSIECKSSEQFNIRRAIEQTKNNQIENTEWMIIYKRKSLKNPVVIVQWKTFEKLFEKIY